LDAEFATTGGHSRIRASRNSFFEVRSVVGGRKRTKKEGKRRRERKEYEEYE
jgi:hypothetical protein